MNSSRERSRRTDSPAALTPTEPAQEALGAHVIEFPDRGDADQSVGIDGLLNRKNTLVAQWARILA